MVFRKNLPVGHFLKNIFDFFQYHEASQFTVQPLCCEVTSQPPCNFSSEGELNENTTESIRNSEKPVESFVQSGSLDISELHLPLPSNASSLVNKLVNTTAATRYS